ncbi:DNA-dependent metalloprotease SPRTN [Brachyhypopomus gauderio]|uniref:DNA-dependent metalloprotease SPRTN n=1 Tax=Brachyhypopomus gauderio TaxID=698409 RepID=UPI00404333A9
MERDDFLLALRLQEQFDNEASASSWVDGGDNGPVSKKRKVGSCGPPDRPLSVVDESWETLDPNPDVRSMFLQFNQMFFWGKLGGVEVKWSPRMTLCAGVCSYEGRGGLCSIRLSEPLLKLRPRRDLVQTLLHEMIHALLFVTQNNRDRDGHGPEFCKHMNRINQASGTKITVYHSFHDEVDVYRQHWWRCDGPCQNRKPFFGYVKRAMNRAPSARDPWWEDHRRTCGGTYTKVKEPENYGKKGKSEEKKEKNASKKVMDGRKPASSSAGSGSQDIRNIIPFSGRGFILGASTQSPVSVQKPRSQSPTLPLRATQEPDKTLPTNLKPWLSPTQTELMSDSTPRPCPPGSDWRVSTSTVTVLPKKSVSNTKAFVNINGSPVRVTKANESLMRPTQRTVKDLFQARSLHPPQKATSTTGALKSVSSTIPNQLSNKPTLNAKPPGQPAQSTKPTKTNLLSRSSTSDTAGHMPAFTEPRLSKYFGNPKNSGGGVPDSACTDRGSQRKPGSGVPGSSSKWFGSPEKSDSCFSVFTPGLSGSPHRAGGAASGGRKRSREERKSAHIFDFFERAVSQSSASSSASVSSGEHREEGRAADAPPGGRSGADSSPFGSAALTVHCPVCQSQVLESKINEHLDSCLT